MGFLDFSTPEARRVPARGRAEPAARAGRRRRARLLARGESVVLDASWSAEAERVLAREVAERTSSRLVELRCTAPTTVTDVRLRTRTGSLSDADPVIARAMAADAEPWPDAATVDTSGTPARALAEARRIVAMG